MKQGISIACIVLFFQSSCLNESNNTYYNTQNSEIKAKIVNFTRNDFPRQVDLLGQDMNITEPLDPFYLEVLRDSLLFVNVDLPTPYNIEIYHLPTKKLLKKFAKQGKGTKEFLSCDIQYTNYVVYFEIFDKTGKTISRLHIDSLIQKDSLYNFTRLSLPGYTDDAACIDNTDAVGFSIYHIEDEKYNNKIPALFKLSNNLSKQEEEDQLKDKYFAANVTGGNILVNKKKNRICVAYDYVDKVDFFDGELNLLSLLRGPDGIKPELKVSKYDPSALLFINGDIYYRAYYPSFSTDDAIYLLYVGSKGKTVEEMYARPMEIFKISWDGELICRYQLDRFISTLSSNSEENIFYGTHKNSADEYPKLVKFEVE